MKTQAEPLEHAVLNPKVCQYWIWYGTLLFVISIIGIPLLLLWIPLSLFFTGRYLARVECVLYPKCLVVNKGILVRVEKTLPLSKITDIGSVEGPIMRVFGVKQLTFETAGQTQPMGSALVSVTGIVDAEGFREKVLAQRDRLEEPLEQGVVLPTGVVGSSVGGNQLQVLTEIRDCLQRIEKQLLN